jgi:ribosome recycling factor
MVESILTDASNKIEQRISFLKDELNKLRLGQATPSLVEDIPVSVYGTSLTIKELGAISAPQPNLLVISCWDDSVVEAVAKAVQQSNIGVNPVVDGKTIKVPIPTLTEERRETMAKEVGEIVEKVRVDIRQIRQDKIKSLDDLKEQKELSEDEHESAKNNVQKVIDQANTQVEEIKAQKLTSLQVS